MQKKTNLVISIIILIASTLFMLFFAYNTSPLINYLGVDSSMYLVIGKFMAQGGTPYSGLFDHKGPIIFIFNMLPQLFIEGTLGVWLIELILIIISSIIVYRIAHQYINNALTLLIPLVYIWITITLFNGGNYTEEYSNFFCVISLFIFNKWLRSPALEKKLTAWMLYILGLCFGLVFFMRPNNVALIVSIIIFIGIYIFRKSHEQTKQFDNTTKHILFTKSIVFGSLGILTVTVPIIIYHLCTGTLYDMFYATILHNIKYCQVGSEPFSFIPNGNSGQLLCFFISLGINVIAMCTCYSNNQIKIGSFILLTFIVVAFSILIGRHPFMYYWTLLAPITSYSSIFIIKYGVKINKKSLMIITITLFFVLMSLNSFYGTEMLDKKSYIAEYKHNSHEIYNQIPNNEKNNCFAYNMPAMFIYEVNLNTPCKYFTMQNWMSKTNLDIAKYCTKYVEENKPEWVLSYFNFKNDNANPELSQIINTNYTQVFNNDCGYLYRKVATIQ